MKLQDYTTPSGFLPHLSCETLEQAVVSLVDRLALDATVVNGADLVHDVMARESEGSTAIGGGLTIPHARSRNARQLRVAVATLSRGLDLPSDDGRPVDVVILLVGPPGDPVPMLRALARLARLVRREPFLAALRAARNAEELSAAFAEAAADSAV